VDGGSVNDTASSVIVSAGPMLDCSSANGYFDLTVSIDEG
jgi:hypothetical protein